MEKHIIFYLHSTLPKKKMASAVQVVNWANASANIGHSSVLVYLKSNLQSFNIFRWIAPFNVEKAPSELENFYKINEKMQVLTLPFFSNLVNTTGIIQKYFLPVHIFPKTKLFYSHDWNFIDKAVRCGVPSVFEWDFPVKKVFEPGIVNNSFFKLAVANTDFVKNNMIEYGIPENKIIQAHNGVNEYFFSRFPEKAEIWRKKLLKNKENFLIVYAGNLNRFKGLDILLGAARNLSHIRFVIAGGCEDEERDYSRKNRKMLENVEFIGHVPHSDLAVLFQASDVLAFPHLSGEAANITSPLKFFEYIASGTPIASTKIPTIEAFGKKDLAMSTCSPDSIYDFTKCIQKVLEKFPRREEGYSQNIELAKQFTWEKRMKRILNFALGYDTLK